MLFMLYDVSDPDSFEFLVQLQQKLNEQKCPIPCIYLATKTDLPAVGQVHYLPYYRYMLSSSLDMLVEEKRREETRQCVCVCVV